MLKARQRRPVMLVMLALLLVGALAVAACGPTPEPEPDPVTVFIDMDEDGNFFFFVERDGEMPDPAAEEEYEIRVEADEAPLIFDLRNLGDEPHDLTIAELDIQYEVAPGTMFVSEPAEIPAGEYAVICSVPGHAALGMTFNLVVE